MKVRCRVETQLSMVIEHPGFGSNPEVNAVAESFVDLVSNKIASYARRNVQPGLGPGPHPHKHMDTGTLMRGIYVTKNRPYSRIVSVAESAVHPNGQPAWVYGTVLEIGWHTSKGFYRYPWMQPAVDIVVKNFDQEVRQYLWRPLEVKLSSSKTIHSTVYER